MSDIAQIGVFKEDSQGILARFVAEADIIFSIDFNQINRLDRLTDTVQANTTAIRVLIDHHLHPPLDEYTLHFSDTHACSTSYIVYQLITALAGSEALTKAMAESLYVGIMTDTGNFAYSNLDADLFRAVAALIDRGISVPLHLQCRLQQLLGGSHAVDGIHAQRQNEAVVETWSRLYVVDGGGDAPIQLQTGGFGGVCKLSALNPRY